MNKIERVRAALAGEPVDRVPASFWFHFPTERASGPASVRSHLDFFRAAGVDYLKVMNEHPYRADHAIQSPADWRSLRPAPRSAPFYTAQLDELKRILDEIGDECLVITTIFGPFASGNHASDHRVVEHIKMDPQSVAAGLGAIAESLAGFSQDCIVAGAAGIYFSAQGGERGRLSEQDFRDCIQPHDRTVLQAAEGLSEFNLLHVCGPNVDLDLFRDYPAHVVNWAVTKNNLSLREGAALFRRPVAGGIDDRGTLVSGPPESIHTAVRGVIEDFGSRQGLIVAADCTLPTDIHVEHIRAAVEATF